MSQANKGFTLVELLVAVGIIGVLASVSIVSINSVRQKARDAKRISEVKQMQNAFEAYMSNNGSYPQGATAIIGDATHDALCADAAGFVGDAAACTQPVFMQKVNRDPLNGAQGHEYSYQAKTAAAANCAAPGPCESYELKFKLEGGSGTLAAGVRTATPNGIE